LQASQADRPQDASIDFGLLQIRMTAICENEIVTLRGEACLVADRSRCDSGTLGNTGIRIDYKIRHSYRVGAAASANPIVND
jgi:hypothetical protein